MSRPLQSWGLAWRMLFNCGYPGTRILLGAFVALMALLAVLLVASNNKTAPGTAPYVLGFALTLLWGGYLPGLLALQRQLDQWRMPGTRHLGLQAMLLAALCSTLLPAAVFALLGASFGHSVAVLTIAIAIGWGYSMLPVIVGAGMIFAPRIGEFLLDQIGVPRPYPSWLLLLIALCAAIGMVWRWQFLRRLPSLDDLAGWRRPMFVTIQAAGGWTGWINNQRDGSTASRLGGTEGWLQDPGQVSREIGLQRPVAAVRTWLGAPFAPRSRTGWLKLIGFVVFLLAVAVLTELKDVRSGKDGGFYLFAIVFGMGMFMLSHPVRLQALVQRRGNEWNDLALLPGIRATAAHRAMLQTQIAGGLVFLVALSALALNGPAHQWLRLILALTSALVLTLVTMTLSLRAVRGHVLHAGSLTLMSVLVLALLTPNGIWIAHPGSGATPYQVLIPLSACVALFAGWLAMRHWKRWIAQPHPFLQW